ncbi:PhoX family protein [Reichenbachiella agarivorans]|uniref:PhoX family protein n=1 Tax=Reichenbachiella agarivorans TaxID=2979464 RepID=A0ABY6CMA5_9BACT|nr:PhoX family protein [Reichenbachiella agarivorans]UXP31210.1 PhoX family protein [Reichenbachiella agarivorans]
MKLFNNLILSLCAAIICGALFLNCEGEMGDVGPAGENGVDGTDGLDGKDGEDGEDLIGDMIPLAYSNTPASILKLAAGFESLDIEVLLSSEDKLPSAPNFVYGSMADGAGLLAEDNGTFTLINNIENDYAIARIILDKNLRPLKGEYILDGVATALTAQCSGSMITPEEHGFGPLYLSGGEWGGASKGVFVTDPYKDVAEASVATMLPVMGQWSTENAVAIGKDAYPGKTVVFIGDDESNDSEPSGQLGMYVGNSGDLEGGKLYGLKVTADGVSYEMDMVEGTSYSMEFVELTETNIDLLDAEAKTKGVMGFSRLEDIDWRRGSAANNREIYFAVTGRNKVGLLDKGSLTGRVYKVVLNDTDPTAAGTITCVLDGDVVGGVAEEFHSPDNIVVTENYAYIQEDPNGVVSSYPNKAAADHFARIYQYNLNTKELKVVLECDQVTAEAFGYGTTANTWEITGMIDVTDIVGSTESTFLVMTQNHGWERSNGLPFTDPTARPDDFNGSAKEGSVLFAIRGLER